MKFPEYARCDGCGKMIPQKGCFIEGRRYCSKECYDFLQWYDERKAYYLEESKRMAKKQ